MDNWISVENRLPIEEDDLINTGRNYCDMEVIVFDRGEVSVDDFQAGNTLHFWRAFASTNPTHWMPLPAPPPEKGDD